MAEDRPTHRPICQIKKRPRRGSGDLGVREVFCQLAVRVIEQRADELQAEAVEAERVRAESRRQQNMSPLEAKVERLERALAYQGAELSKLKGTQHGQLPSLPHVPRAKVPQFLGMPSGMGRAWRDWAGREQRRGEEAQYG
jgi:hypothetical protein